MMARETRKAMTKAIRRMKREGFSRREIVANARKMVGLNQQQANSVLSRMKKARDSGVGRGKLQREFDRVTARQFRNRGKMTGAHETKIGAEMGQDVAVAHAVDEGEIENPRERWVSIRDGRRDPICKRLHGQTVPLGKRFTDPSTGNSYKGPPEPHMTCRCGKHLMFRKVPAERRAKAGSVVLHEGIPILEDGHLWRIFHNFPGAHGGTGGRRGSAAMGKKVDEMPALGSGFQSIAVDHGLGAHTRSPINSTNDADLVETKRVNIADLTPTQDGVFRSRLKAAVTEKSFPLDAPVSVVRHNGKMFLHDGTTRVTAHKLLGNKTVEANIYTPKSTQSSEAQAFHNFPGAHGGAGGGGGGKRKGKTASGKTIDGVMDGEGVNKKEVIDGAQKKLADLEVVKKLPQGDEVVKHPIKFDDNPPFTPDDLEDVSSRLDSVNVSELRTFSQGTIVRNIAADKIDGLFKDQMPIVVVKSGNKSFIMDGHHRGTAAILSGKKTIKARVFEVES
jgi:hypothetical protein